MKIMKSQHAIVYEEFTKTRFCNDLALQFGIDHLKK
jgi:hypothetical protein